MRTTKMAAVLAAGALIAWATWSPARAQPLPEGTVYTLHSKPAGNCPALDWHLVSGTDNSLTGMISWDNMKSMAHATGTFDPSRHFMLTATEVGGTGKTATITGTARSDGWLVADVTGPGIECKGITIPISREWGGKQ